MVFGHRLRENVFGCQGVDCQGLNSCSFSRICFRTEGVFLVALCFFFPIFLLPSLCMFVLYIYGACTCVSCVVKGGLCEGVYGSECGEVRDVGWIGSLGLRFFFQYINK